MCSFSKTYETYGNIVRAFENLVSILNRACVLGHLSAEPRLRIISRLGCEGGLMRFVMQLPLAFKRNLHSFI